MTIPIDSVFRDDKIYLGSVIKKINCLDDNETIEAFYCEFKKQDSEMHNQEKDLLLTNLCLIEIYIDFNNLKIVKHRLEHAKIEKKYDIKRYDNSSIRAIAVSANIYFPNEEQPFEIKRQEDSETPSSFDDFINAIK